MRSLLISSIFLAGCFAYPIITLGPGNHITHHDYAASIERDDIPADVLDSLQTCYGYKWWEIMDDIQPNDLAKLVGICAKTQNKIDMSKTPAWCNDIKCLEEKMFYKTSSKIMMNIKEGERSRWRKGEPLFGPSFWETLHPLTKRYYLPRILDAMGIVQKIPGYALPYPDEPVCFESTCLYTILGTKPHVEDFVTYKFPFLDSLNKCYGKNWYKNLNPFDLHNYADDLTSMCWYVSQMNVADNGYAPFEFIDVSDQDAKCNQIECLYNLPFYKLKSE